jgi:hypothetical protein
VFRRLDLCRELLHIDSVLWFRAWVGYCPDCRWAYWMDGSLDP